MSRPRIANFRKIDWELLAINFVMVFSPNTLAGAPHRVLVTLEYPKGTDSAREAKLVQALADRFPLVTAIKVGDIVEAAKDLLQKVMTAIGMTAGVTLLIGALVLAGAVAATQQRRKYQAVLYKTLGATRGRIVRAELLEFGLLGVAVAAFAVAAGTITAWALCKWALRGAVHLLRPLPQPKPCCLRSRSCSGSAPSPPGGCCRPRPRLICAANRGFRECCATGTSAHLRGGKQPPIFAFKVSGFDSDFEQHGRKDQQWRN